MIAWQPVLAAEDAVDGLPAVTKSERPASPARALAEVPLLAVTAVIIAFVLKTFLAQAFFIPSASMVPQLEVGDRVVVSKLAYRLHDARRGDVVVFHSPEQAAEPPRSLPVRVVLGALEAVGLRRPDDRDLIKRVIGLPGDAVTGRNGRIFVNGHPLTEPYLPPGVLSTEFGPTRVPADHVFVMGDNRPNSRDSRWFGPVPLDNVVGRAVVRVWPPQRLAFL